MSPELEIKTATADDVSLVFSFIRELVIFQNLLNQFSTTEESLQNFLFGPHKYAEVIIVYITGQPVGYALFFYNFSTFTGSPGIYLEDLYVKPNYRKHGIGHIMLKYLANLAKEIRCGHLELRVIETNNSAINFYEAMGAKVSEEWLTYTLDKKILDNLS